MAYPTVTQTWTISANNRYVYTSVLGAMQAFMLSLKNFLKTTMTYTVKGSCSAGTGAMDGVDRWSLTTDVTPRNNGAAGSQAWFVFTDGNGIDICFSFNAASDDIFRIAHSPGGNYVAAATANQQPTATDEVFDVASVSWVNSNTSADRVWHMWSSSDKKMFRAAIWRNQALSSFLGVERFSTSLLLGHSTFTLANGGGTALVYRFFYTNAAYSLSNTPLGVYSAGSGGALTRVHTSADFTLLLGSDQEWPWSGRPDTIAFSQENPELQGSQGEYIFPVGTASQTANAQGRVATRFDWWCALGGGTTVPPGGDTLGGLAFIALGPTVLWPWDSSTVPFIM